MMSPDPSREQVQSAKVQSLLQRLFDGWQAGAIIIFLVLMVLAVAIPRPAVQLSVPLPIPDERQLARIEQQQERLAQQVASAPLKFDTRALGEALRSYGLADAHGDSATAQRMLVAIQMRRAAAMQRDGRASLLYLRAYQAHVFFTELDRYLKTGRASKALEQVGGGIIKTLLAAGWVTSEGKGPRELIAGRSALRAMFNKRWNTITGLRDKTFSLSLDEQRALYVLLLTHPKPPSTEQRYTAVASRCQSANSSLLRYVGRLGRLDPDYPANYARGLILLRMGQTREAIFSLANFVEHHPDGTYVLLARNALRMAQDRAMGATKR